MLHASLKDVQHVRIAADHAIGNQLLDCDTDDEWSWFSARLIPGNNQDGGEQNRLVETWMKISNDAKDGETQR